MNILNTAYRMTHELRTRYRRRRTQSILEGLPSHLRKDIGWPARDFDFDGNHCR